MIRLADHRIDPGVVSEGVEEGDEWPGIRERIVAAEILIVATPTWLGQPSSICKRALERMDAMLSETRDDGETPIAYGDAPAVARFGTRLSPEPGSAMGRCVAAGNKAAATARATPRAMIATCVDIDEPSIENGVCSAPTASATCSMDRLDRRKRLGLVSGRLAALAPRRLLLLGAAALLGVALGRRAGARLLATATRRPLGVRDRRGTTLAQALLPEPLVLLVVLDAGTVIFAMGPSYPDLRDLRPGSTAGRRRASQRSSEIPGDALEVADERLELRRDGLRHAGSMTGGRSPSRTRRALTRSAGRGPWSRALCCRAGPAPRPPRGTRAPAA
jgi:hypothetical protein